MLGSDTVLRQEKDDLMYWMYAVRKRTVTDGFYSVF